jgi:putative membrane protein
MIVRRKFIFLSSALFIFSSYFMLRFQDISSFSWISGLFIILFALPSYYSLVKNLGNRKGVLLLIILSILPVVVEGVAVWTGYPYGGFEYGERLGWLLFGVVPPTISFAYLPILLGSLYFASKNSSKFFIFCSLASIFNLLVDLVIDPAAVHIGFWSYTHGGFYFGVPLSNFLGWLITGFIYASIFYFVVEKKFFPLPSMVSISLIWILSFWSGYLILVNLLMPALLGLTLCSYLLIMY